MLEYVAGNDEIETVSESLGRGRDIQPWLLVEEGVRIVQLLAEPRRIIFGVRQPYAADVATPWQLADGHASAEQLGREQVHYGPVAHRRPAAGTGWYLTLECRLWHGTGAAADLAPEVHVPAVGRNVSRMGEGRKLTETLRYLCRQSHAWCYVVRCDVFIGGASSPPKDHVPDAVPQADAAALELGQRPVCRSRCVAVGSVLEQGLGSERGQDLRGVVLPVRRRMQKAAGREPERKLVHEW